MQITTIFPLNGVGITTARDDFVIDFDQNSLVNRIRAFKHSDLDDAMLHKAFGIRVKKGWSIRKAWQQLQQLDDANLKEYIQPVLYRPFDVRYIFYHAAVVWSTVKRVMRHMLAGENIALVAPKRVEHAGSWQHAFATDCITEHVAVSLKTIDYHFPLYLYPDEERPGLFTQAKTPNLDEALLKGLAAAYGAAPAPEDILAYIYAVFYSPTYRERYADFLRVDFPRVPFPADAEVFGQMAALGRRLVDLHVLKSAERDPPAVKYQGAGGDDTIERVRYDAAAARVHINAAKYFEGVTPAMWEYQIGGYQVLEKYLKDRRGRRMDDPVRYIRIATAIARTMALQEEIDQVYPLVEAELLSL